VSEPPYGLTWLVYYLGLGVSVSLTLLAFTHLGPMEGLGILALFMIVLTPLKRKLKREAAARQNSEQEPP
jgi:hypothetical protein